MRALKASIRRAWEGVQAGESGEMGGKAFNLCHRLESSDSTVHKVVFSDWYWGLHSTEIVQMLHYTVKARRGVNICLTSAMVQRQLAMTLDRNCKDLKTQGSRGALFQITLASHGYTFVGKGTRDVFVPDLMHEGRMYDRLKSIQGKLIPVYLGNIDLDRPWLDLGVESFICFCLGEERGLTKSKG